MRKGFLSSGPAKGASKDAELKTLPQLSKHLCGLVSKSSNGSCALSHRDGEGRLLVATRNVSAGEILLTAEYFATVAAEGSTDICSRCFRRGSTAACKGCGSCYCSSDCLNMAGPGDHCFPLGRLQSQALTPPTPAACRTCVRVPRPVLPAQVRRCRLCQRHGDPAAGRALLG